MVLTQNAIYQMRSLIHGNVLDQATNLQETVTKELQIGTITEIAGTWREGAAGADFRPRERVTTMVLYTGWARSWAARDGRSVLC